MCDLVKLPAPINAKIGDLFGEKFATLYSIIDLEICQQFLVPRGDLRVQSTI